MDALPSTISVLKSISKEVKAINPKVEVYIDGGVMRGTDVLKCLGLGANMVFLGRAVGWSLHQGAKDGVLNMLSLIHEELKSAMILTSSMDVS